VRVRTPARSGAGRVEAIRRSGDAGPWRCDRAGRARPGADSRGRRV